MAGFSPAKAASVTTLDFVDDSAASTEGLGFFSGSLSFDQAVQQLTVVLKNISPVSNGGFITAFGLNIDGNAAASSLLSFSGFDTADLLLDTSTGPFGDVDFGVTTGGNFEGSGPPSPGIGVGESGTFVFDITGPDAPNLVAASFFSELSTGQGNNGNEAPLVVRFRGFEDGGSDFVPGGPEAPPLPPDDPDDPTPPGGCLLYTSPSPRDQRGSRMPSSA